MSEQMDNMASKSDSTGSRANEKKPGVRADFSGAVTKGFSFRFNKKTQDMRPFELLEELSEFCGDDTLTRDEKNARIKKMLETMQ